MNLISTRQLRLSLSALALAGFIFITQAQPAQAGFLDWIFGNNDHVGDLINAGEKADAGTLSQGPTVSNTTGFFMTDAFVRLAGPDAAHIPASQQAYFYKKYGNGAIADVAGAIPYLFQPPATTQTFVADLLDSAHIVPRAQAQGLGFSALDPILATWKMFRNLAYLLYVVVFLVIGLMVMFKSQMGKTAVTLQSAIPNIIISLIFVTFSYAIAGFLIDIMYVLMYLLVGMFPDAQGAKILDFNFLEFGKTIIMGDGMKAGAFTTFSDTVNEFVTKSMDVSGVGTDTTSTFGWISGVTMGLIVVVAILIGVFKLFFELLKTYVTVVLLIAFSPLLLMMGAIPGQDVFGSWIRDVAGNLLAFPTALLIIIVFRMFSDGSNIDATTSSGFLPPFLIGRGSASALTTLVGIGIVLIMPELIQQMKKAVGVKDSIFSVLAKDANKNLQDASYVGSMPTAAVANSLGGAANSAINYRKAATKRGDFSMKGMGRAAIFGNDVKNKEGERVGSDGGLVGTFMGTSDSMTAGLRNVGKTAGRMSSAFKSRNPLDLIRDRDNKNKEDEKLDNLGKTPPSPTSPGTGGL